MDFPSVQCAPCIATWRVSNGCLSVRSTSNNTVALMSSCVSNHPREEISEFGYGGGVKFTLK